METRFLLGPAGSGKTFRCLQEIRSALKAEPAGLPLVLLAPRQATYQLERALLSDPELPGYSRLQILSFERLAEFIIDQFLVSPPMLLNEEGRVMVLRALLGEKRGELRLFHATARLPGFAQQLGKLLDELQRHQVSAADLIKLSEKQTAVPQLREKLHDVAILLQAYRAWLKENELRDANSLLDLAAAAVTEAIRKSEFRLGGLWLDGFSEITPQQLELLAALVPGCEHATLAFCLDGRAEANDWYSIWSSVNETFGRCLTQLEALPGVKCATRLLERRPEQSRFAGNPVLAHLERHWDAPEPLATGAWQLAIAESRAASTFETQSAIGHRPSAIRLCACPNPEVEAAVAAREILRHVRDRGGRFRDTAVLVRSLDAYASVVRRVFTRYEIPFFLDRREAISHHALAELTRYALRIAARGWEHDDWFGALKTGLVHREESSVDWLENEALARGWTGNIWLSPLKIASHPQREERLEEFRRKVVPPFRRFAEALNSVERTPTGLHLAGAIRDLWSELRVPDTLQQWSERLAASKSDAPASILRSEIHAGAWEEMQKWLDSLELAFENTALPLGDWLSVVEAGLASLSVGVVPPALDQVLVGAVDRSRNPDLRLVLVLGLNETVFPATPPSPPLLNEGDREALASLGVTLGMARRRQLGFERYLGYIAVTRARERVVLTYALRNSNDAPLNRSPFIDQQLQQLFPGLQPEPIDGTADWRESIHASELVVPLLRNKVSNSKFQVSSLGSLETLPLFAPVVARWDQVAKARATTQLSTDMAEKLYGPELETSISALEDYAACPFKFFVGRGLRAEERQEFEADRRERGSFQHEVLMEFHRRVQTQGKRWRDLTLVEARALIEQVGQEVKETFRDGLLVSTAERRFMARTLIGNLKTLIEVLVGWASQYDFEPRAVEISFGMEEGDLQPWRIDLNGGHSLLLRGRIDRVDLYRPGDEEAYAVVIDYKSSGQELEAAKLHGGLDLQLLAYLGVLQHSPNVSHILRVAKLVPAGAFYVSLRNPGGSAKTRAEVMAEREAARRAGYQHRGRFCGDKLSWFDNRNVPKGDQFRYWIKKDGEFSKVGNEAMPTEEFLGLLHQIEDFLRRYGQEIYAGDARVAPYRYKEEKACDRCDYRSICRFDPWIEPYRVLKLPEPK